MLVSAPLTSILSPRWERSYFLSKSLLETLLNDIHLLSERILLFLPCNGLNPLESILPSNGVNLPICHLIGHVDPSKIFEVMSIRIYFQMGVATNISNIRNCQVRNGLFTGTC